MRPSLMLLAAGVIVCAGCPTVDLGETPVAPGSCRPDRAYFEETIWPEFVAPADTARSCVDAAACHRDEDGRSALRFDTTDPIDQDRNFDVLTRFLDCGAPESSTALTKPLSGLEPHGGGDLFDPGSDAEATFLQWFAQ